ncbi:hypothetical protein [Streptomyces sp. LaBMicrA B280]|uniref:hypothetical protein n=1 Tax=Streptomyces sp. LaBMicrA B280 TaxID=3391001 RepID=UPI003BA47997
MIVLMLVLFFGFLLTSPIWMTWGAGKFSKAFSKPKFREGSEVLFIIAVVLLLFILTAGLALFSGV